MQTLKITLSLLFTLLAVSCFSQNDEPTYGNNSYAGHYADANGIKMYYETYGKGQPLLLIHGNGGSIRSSSGQITFFSQYYQVIAADSRGQGKTNDNSDSLTYTLMTEDYNALLNYLQLDSVLIFGQSDGAIIGLLLAARHPEKVKMLAAMSPNLRPDDDVLYPDVVTLDHVFYKNTEQKLKEGKQGAEREMKLQRLMKYHPHISVSELKKIKAPVLLTTGDRDMIRLTHIIEIFDALPYSNLSVLPGSTHFALRENPLVFNQILYRFFSEPFKMPSSTDMMKKIIESRNY